ncbi:MAG: hypothetical protein K2M41_06910 [Muribaculaceae bacterium]|nr:hypothetical protein [Muribaculaceae bacterium]
MSEQKMNSYRFSSGEEPSDEMLAQLMKEVFADAKTRQQQATSAYFTEMRKNAEARCNAFRLIAINSRSA